MKTYNMALGSSSTESHAEFTDPRRTLINADNSTSSETRFKIYTLLSITIQIV